MERFFFLQASGVGQHDVGKCNRSWGCIDGPAKAGSVERWQIAAVVEMGVGEHHCVEMRDIKRGCLPVAQPEFFLALVEACIDQH